MNEYQLSFGLFNSERNSKNKITDQDIMKSLRSINNNWDEIVKEFKLLIPKEVKVIEYYGNDDINTINNSNDVDYAPVIQIKCEKYLIGRIPDILQNIINHYSLKVYWEVTNELYTIE